MPEKTEVQKLQDLLESRRIKMPSESAPPERGPEPLAIGRMRRRPTTWYEANTRQGIPIDTKTGGPGDLRVALAFHDDIADKVTLVNNYYGTDGARPELSTAGQPTGNIIVPLQNTDSGEPFDMLIDEKQFTLRDMNEMAPVLVEMIGAALGAKGASKLGRLGRARGITGAARSTVAGAVGANVAGGTSSAMAEGMSGSLDPGEAKEIAKERMAMTVVDMGLDAGLLGAARLFQIGFTPFGRKADARRDAIVQARNRLESASDETLPLTPGELTGRNALLRGEGLLSELPGSSATFDRIKAQKNEFFAKVENLMLSLPKDATPEQRRALLAQIGDPGPEALDAIKDSITARQHGIETLKKNFMRRIKNDIVDRLDTIYPGTRTPTNRRIGENIRDAAIAKKELFQSEASARYDIPGADDRFFTPSTLSRRVKQFLNELPQETVTTETGQKVQTPARIVDPLVRSTSEKLRALAREENQMSLNDMIGVRIELDNLITKGQAIGNVRDARLVKLRDLVTTEMDRLTREHPDPDLRDRWIEANQWYKQNIKKFQSNTVKTLFKDPAEGLGGIIDDAIVGHAAGDASRYNELKSFLGPQSREFKQLQRGIARMIFDPAVDAVGGISPNILKERLHILQKNNPEAFGELFGATAKDLYHIGRLLQAVPGNMRLPAAEVEEILTSRTSSRVSAAQDLSRLIQSERALNREYSGNLMRAIRKGDIGEFAIDPAEFIRRFWRDASVNDVKQATRVLANRPGMMQKIRTLAMEDIFATISGEASAFDMKSFASGGVFEPKAIHQLGRLLKDRSKADKFEALFGRETLSQLRDIATLSESSLANMRSAGGISTGMQMAALFRADNLFRSAHNFVMQKLAAVAMTSPVMRGWLTNDLFKESRNPQAIMAIVTSEPVAREIIATYGKSGFDQIVLGLQDGFERWIDGPGDVTRGETNIPAPSTEMQRLQESLRQRVLPAPRTP